MKIKKFFGFGEKAPFKSELFNSHTNFLFGKNGLIDELNIESKDGKILISNLVFVSNGIIIVLEETIERTIPEKYFNKPCVLVAGVSDNTEKSNIIFDFISSDEDLQSQVVIARFDGVEWFSEEKINSAGIINKIEELFKTIPINFNKGLEITRSESKLFLSPGYFLNKEGKLVQFKKCREFELPIIDQLFPNRMDIILYKKNKGYTTTGTFELISGPTLSGLPNEKKSGKTNKHFENNKASFFSFGMLPNEKKCIARIGYFKNKQNNENLTAIYFNNNFTEYFGAFTDGVNPTLSCQTNADELDFIHSTKKVLYLTRYIYKLSKFEKKFEQPTILADYESNILSCIIEKDRFNNNYILSSINNNFKREYYLKIFSENLTDRLKLKKIITNGYDAKIKVDSQLRIHIAYTSSEGLKYEIYSYTNNNLNLEKEIQFDNAVVFDLKLMSDDTLVLCYYKNLNLHIYFSNEEKPRIVNLSYNLIKLDFEINDLGWLHFLSLDKDNILRQFDFSISKNKIETVFFQNKLQNNIFEIKIIKEKLGSLSLFYSSHNFSSVNSIALKSSYIGENTFDGIKSLPWQVLISKSEITSKKADPISGDFLKFSDNKIKQIIKTDIVIVNATEHFIFDMDSFTNLEPSQNKEVFLIKNCNVNCTLFEENLPGLASCSAKDFVDNELNSNIIHSVIERQNNTIHKRSFLLESRVGNGHFFKYAFNKDDSSDINSEANHTTFSDIGALLPNSSCTKAVSIPIEIVSKRNINVTLEIIDERSSLPKDAFYCFPKIVLDNETYGIGWEFNENNSILITFYEKPNFDYSWADLRNKGIKYRVLFTENIN